MKSIDSIWSTSLEKTKALNNALTSLNHVHTATLDALSKALDFRDQSTSGHSRRVADLTACAAASMGVKDSALVQIEHGALLHDIGKLKILDSILWKPSKLNEEEWQTMRRHPEYGYAFLSSVEFLKAQRKSSIRITRNSMGQAIPDSCAVKKSRSEPGYS